MPQFWGDLLAGLEHDAATRGEVVTAVRFDGVDEPTFREPVQIARDVRGFEVIEIRTENPRALLDDVLGHGASAATALAAAAGRTGEAFRGSDLAQANQGLSELGDGIRTLTDILATSAGVLGVPLHQMEWNGRVVSDRLSELVGQLESVVEAQQAQDWLTVADILEYDFQPALAAWRPVFESLRTPAADRA